MLSCLGDAARSRELLRYPPAHPYSRAAFAAVAGVIVAALLLAFGGSFVAVPLGGLPATVPAPHASSPTSSGESMTSYLAHAPHSYIGGVDVYGGTGTVTWSSVASAGYTFAFTKATQGTDFEDSSYSTNMAGAHAAGMYVGGYDFACPATDSSEDCTADNATSEANYFDAYAGSYFKDGYLYPVLDYEIGCNSASDAKSLSTWAGIWLSTVVAYAQSKDGVTITPIIYTYVSEAETCIESWLTQYPLWIANYGVSSPTTTPWSTWAFWQYSDTGSVSGISGDVDMDYFVGTTSELNSTYTFGGTGGGTGPAPLSTPTYAMEDQTTNTALSCGDSFAAGDTINFTVTESGGTLPYTYDWAFGDGKTTNTPHPGVNHIYTTAGTVNPLITVVDAKGNTSAQGGTSCDFTVTGSVSALTATASVAPSTGTAPLLVKFTGVAGGGAGTDTWFWNFGDGTTYSTTQSPSHTYSAPGLYVATLTVNDTAGQTATNSTRIYAISTTSSPTIKASGSPLTGTSPLTVDFSSTPYGGSGSYTSYVWSFGDGKSGSGQSPTHVYWTNTSTTFAATVTVTDSTGATATSASVNVSVSAPVSNPPSITAKANSTYGYASLSVAFTSVPAGGSGTYTSYAWNFGDGGTAGSQDTTHVYTTPGHYNATVTVTDSNGHTGTSTAIEISVLPLPSGSGTPLSVQVSGTSSAIVDLPATLTATASGGSGSYTEFAWTFGDGNSATTSTPTTTHTYSTVGSFGVTVQVTDSTGATATSATAWTVTVSAAPRDGVVTGQVRNASDLFLLGGATVTVLLVSSGAQEASVETGANGSFQFAFPAGNYVVNVTAPDYRSLQQTVELTAGALQPLYFNLTWLPPSHSGSSGTGTSPVSALGFLTGNLTLVLLVVAVAAIAIVAGALLARSRKGGSPPETEAYPEPTTASWTGASEPGSAYEPEPVAPGPPQP